MLNQLQRAAIAALGFTLGGAVVAQPASNALAPVGMNLAFVNYWSSEQPFLNILKTADGWLTHTNANFDTNEQQYLDLDADGYPKSLTAVREPAPQQFNSLGVTVLHNLPQAPQGYYAPGRYVVLYDGEGSLAYGFDARLVKAGRGRDVIEVALPSPLGIFIEITSTDPKHNGNYIHNMRLVKAEYEAALNTGAMFNPNFLNLLRSFRALRFMDWLRTNDNTQINWSDRPRLERAFWGSSAGVPLEVAIRLANEVSADAWLNIPVMASDDYIRQMAALVHSQLGAGQRVYLELSNEVWNASFKQHAYSMTRGRVSLPSSLDELHAGWQWYGMRTAQAADIWYGVYGSSFPTQVTVVMSGQGGRPDVLKEELATPDWTGRPAAAHHIGAGAISMYFGDLPNQACLVRWTAEPDGGLDALFRSLYAQNDPSVPPGGYLAQAFAFSANHAALLAPYHLPLYGYEGGQSFQGFPAYQDGSAVVNLLVAANRDARMKAAYTNYLNGWKAHGGTLFMQYNDISAPNKYGEWGALESFMQPTVPLSDAPPKWQALQGFINNNNCWWAGCRRP